LLGENCSLVCAWYSNKIVSAAIFIHAGEFIHYHFSGSDEAYNSKAPNHLLLYEVIKWAKDNGFKKLHLGGGVDGPEDELFLFKAGFSRCRGVFYTYENVHNASKYRELSERKCQRDQISLSEIERSTFFPFYRRGK
jgi:lipid II:glycine glycyltransferase (peptidoglycan interpeptide bridge formation enzyme)